MQATFATACVFSNQQPINQSIHSVVLMGGARTQV
jgi:inosine-uridine nucleoside N-ribohydrolase